MSSTINFTPPYTIAWIQDVEPAEPRIPWEAPELYPPKPDESSFGFMDGKKPRPCSRDELVEKVRSSESIAYVWTPGTARMVPPGEVDFLFDAVKANEWRALRWALIFAALGTPFLIWLSRVFDAEGCHVFGWLLIVMAAGFPALFCRQAWFVRTLSPESLQRREKSRRYCHWLNEQHPSLAPLLGVSILYAAVFVAIGTARAHGLPATFTAENLMLLHGLISTMALGGLLEIHTSKCWILIAFGLGGMCGAIGNPGAPMACLSAFVTAGAAALFGAVVVFGSRHQRFLPAEFLIPLGFGVLVNAGVCMYAPEAVHYTADLAGLTCGMAVGVLWMRPASVLFPAIPNCIIRIVGVVAALWIVGFAAASICAALCVIR